MERPSWAPEDVNPDLPSVARVYDYYLGGSHNFATDRAFAKQVIQSMPDIVVLARDNRAFLRRAVAYLCRRGITQFIDLGSGIPTVGNVHEVAQEINPTARVAYVDLDPVAVAHSRTILAGNPNTAVVAADLREPTAVLSDPGLMKIIDFTEPIAFMFVAVLHFVPDEGRPADIVAGYAATGVPGSHVVIAHSGVDRDLSDGEDEAFQLYRKSPNPIILRTPAQVTALFGDLTPIEPGVVAPHLWRPDAADEAMAGDKPRLGSVGVGRKD